MPNSGRIYDELLVLYVQSGNRRALALLARRWQPRLLRTARRLTGDGDAAVDLVQDAWLAILRGLPRLREPSHFPAWAFAILRRRAATALGETIRRRARSVPLEQDGVPAAGDCDPAERIALDRAFAALNPDQRLAASLFFVERLTLDEIALATGAPTGTVKSRIFHARQILKRHLTGDDHA